MAIRENLAEFRERLNQAAQKYGRNPDDVGIMAVSKTRSVDEILEARESGLTLFGENRVEEAAGKFTDLDPEAFPLVLIGHLQSNKVARIDRRFDGVHSVDSVKLAQRLSRQRAEINRPLEVLLQVNTSGEDSKSGFRDREEFREAASAISEMPYLDFRGLMTMAPFVPEEKPVRDCFALCRDWGEDVGHLVRDKLILSMGMSSDFVWAVAEGSTLLRIGTTLFGAR